MSEIDVPGPWRVDTDTEEASQEYNPRAQPLVRLERDSLDLWITIERRDPTEGSPRDIVQYLFTIGLNADGPGPRKIQYGREQSRASADRALNNARSAASDFAYRFEEKYEETSDELEACEYALNQIQDQHSLDW